MPEAIIDMTTDLRSDVLRRPMTAGSTTLSIFSQDPTTVPFMVKVGDDIMSLERVVVANRPAEQITAAFSATDTVLTVVSSAVFSASPAAGVVDVVEIRDADGLTVFETVTVTDVPSATTIQVTRGASPVSGPGDGTRTIGPSRSTWQQVDYTVVRSSSAIAHAVGENVTQVISEKYLMDVRRQAQTFGLELVQDIADNFYTVQAVSCPRSLHTLSGRNATWHGQLVLIPGMTLHLMCYDDASPAAAVTGEFLSLRRIADENGGVLATPTLSWSAFQDGNTPLAPKPIVDGEASVEFAVYAAANLDISPITATVDGRVRAVGVNVLRGGTYIVQYAGRLSLV